MSVRSFYSSSIPEFLRETTDSIIGKITQNHTQQLEHLQTGAWRGQISVLQDQLSNFDNGEIHFEFLIPRMGRRADVVILYAGIVFVLEFKVGSNKFHSQDLRQSHDYALDLSYFHEGSHNLVIIPFLVASNAPDLEFSITPSKDKVYGPIKANNQNLLSLILGCIKSLEKQPALDYQRWLKSSYKPTPTIIEVAQALYANHEVDDISRNDAGAKNLNITSKKLQNIIHHSRIDSRKSICFVTGVPGAGKTLVGLNIATENTNSEDAEHAVFLSGNGPLVEVLREALVRDEVSRGSSRTKSEAKSKVHSFIQNIHHFRDDGLKDSNAPFERVVIFDEAQRAWDKHHTSQFMRQKRSQDDFDQSEPEFLISVMDRHQGWCVIVCLIGGGQEINKGEAGLQGWFDALEERFNDWDIYYSDKLKQSEYVDGGIVLLPDGEERYKQEDSLHLGTSMRSFKAERLSHMVHYIIHNNPRRAKENYQEFRSRFPIKVTRDLMLAKAWIRKESRGTEKKGLIASSGANRLKPKGIFVKNRLSASCYFLNGDDDVRSCHYLEDVATEFDIQGLELDWCLVCWGADYRYIDGAFQHWEFKGTKWNRRQQESKQRYLENAYRVLLTRARQGMVIFVPVGSDDDQTRAPEFYDQSYNYLIKCGVEKI